MFTFTVISSPTVKQVYRGMRRFNPGKPLEPGCQLAVVSYEDTYELFEIEPVNDLRQFCWDHEQNAVIQCFVSTDVPYFKK